MFSQNWFVAQNVNSKLLEDINDNILKNLHHTAYQERMWQKTSLLSNQGGNLFPGLGKNRIDKFLVRIIKSDNKEREAIRTKNEENQEDNENDERQHPEKTC